MSKLFIITRYRLISGNKEYFDKISIRTVKPGNSSSFTAHTSQSAGSFELAGYIFMLTLFR